LPAKLQQASAWRDPARLYLNVERAYREFRNEPEDKPSDSAKSFDSIYKVAKAKGLAVEF
jgi:cyclase